MKKIMILLLFLLPILRGAIQAQDSLRLSSRVQKDSLCRTATLTLMAHGGTPPYRFAVDFSPFTSDSVFHNLVVGFYTLKVIDAQGHQAKSFYENGYLPQGPRFQTTFRQANCTSPTGTLSVNIFGDTSGMPFRFRVDNTISPSFSSATVTLPNIERGLHNVALLFGNGCANERWVNLEDSTFIPHHQYTYNSVCGNASELRITTYPKRNYTYILDNLPSTTNPLWLNILPGTHIVNVSEPNGCTKIDTFQLQTTGMNINIVAISTTCRESLGLFRIIPTGGQPPFSFSVNGSTATSADTFRLANGQHLFKIVDAVGCRFEGSRYVYRLADSVRYGYNFNPNGCGATTGTLTITFPDSTRRPLSISLDSSAFTSNYTFQNVRTGNHTVRFTLLGGCEQVGTLTLNATAPLQLFLNDSCSNLRGLGHIFASVYGGTLPYTYRWSNGGTTSVLQNVPSNLYTITVTDATGCTIIQSKSLTSCVWAGDTDTSGVVDNRDILNIGIAFGETGTRRCTDSSAARCITWSPKKAADWSKQTPAGTNYKHIDTNGDGTINAADTVAIIQNWSRVHQSVYPQTPIMAAQSVVPPIYIQASNVREGDWASFPIMLGEIGTQAENVYGLAFSIKYPPSVIEPNTLRLVVGQSWLGATSALLNVFKDEFDNVCHIGLVKTNKQNITGAGQIATLVFKLKAGTKGTDLQFGVYNDYLINNVGQQLTSIGRVTKVTVLTETAEPIWANQISVYPNPTTDKIYIDAQNIDIQKVILLDIAGKMIQTVPKNTPLSILTAGIYFLKIETDKGVVMKKVVKM